MIRLRLDDILKATGGQVLSRVKDEFAGIATDSRADATGRLFIALKGDAFDAHDFVAAAVSKGAAGLLVHRDVPELAGLKGRVTVVRVDDTLKALQAMGRFARRASKASFIGVTGSNGKTTTKEFTAAVISPFRETHFAHGSFNNHWGVPMTLLEVEPSDEVAVIEIGMNHAGEIAHLMTIAEPDVVVCTSVGRAHIEYFGSIEKIAEVKEETYEAAPPTATRIYNLDNPWTKAMHGRAAARFPKARVMTFSADHANADVLLRLSDVTMRDLEVEGRIGGREGRVRVPVFGSHNVTNLMAAAAAALAVGLEPDEIWQGLTRCRTAWGRNQFVKLKSGAEMIFDAYNANPDSMGALLENLRLVRASGRKIGVFGQMKELGELSPELHRELGRKVGGAGFDEVFFIGADADSFRRGLEEGHYRGPTHFGADYEDGMGRQLASGLRAGDIVLVKGSRGMKLERFVEPCEPLDFGKK